MSDVKHTSYSEEALGKALELLNQHKTFLGEYSLTDHSVATFATYIQQVSDAVKEADKALEGSAYIRDSVPRNKLKPFILSDPVDPLLREAREIVARVARRRDGDAYAEAVLRGDWDQDLDVQSALEALKSREAK